MHRVGALYHRRRVEVEFYRLVTVGNGKAVRRGSVHSEIGGVNSVGNHRIAQVHNEGSRRGARKQAAASRISVRHSETHQLPVCEGILLGLAANGYAPVRP